MNLLLLLLIDVVLSYYDGLLYLTIVVSFMKKFSKLNCAMDLP